MHIHVVALFDPYVSAGESDLLAELLHLAFQDAIFIRHWLLGRGKRLNDAWIKPYYDKLDDRGRPQE